jgi:hypothetical protein
MAGRNDDKRLFPRTAERIPVQLSMRSGNREFSARVYTFDISLTGVFFATDFFLKVGMELEAEFQMPDDDRIIHTRGVIVREVRVDERRPQRKDVVSGFAMRFTEYFDDAKTTLAGAFLGRELGGFVDDYLRRRTKKRKTEAEQLRDVIVAWEVSRMDLGLGERELLMAVRKKNHA